MPIELRFRWTQSEIQTFPYLGIAARQWDQWCSRNHPSQEQVFRKLLLDLYIEWQGANHRGDDFDTRMAIERFAEFRACTGQDICSRAEYATHVQPLQTAIWKWRERWVATGVVPPEGELARALVDFVLTGPMDGVERRRGVYARRPEAERHV
jgi:hypothetical protein